MDMLWTVIGLILGVLLVSGVAARLRFPAPILLLLVGFAVSFIPGVPSYSVDPEFVLFVLLPPLLYAAAVDSGVVAIRKLLAPIMRLAVGLVLVTAFAVAFALQWVVPQIPFAAALALGAIVAPPDAVAAVAVGRRVGLPRRVMTVLEGESLLNDATSLVTLRVSLVALAAGSFAWGAAVGEFVWAMLGGAAAGLLIGWVMSFVRRRIQSPVVVTALSLLTPFIAYLVGEQLQASGVLTVVVAGLYLGFTAPTDLAASVRLTESATWSSLRYVLEGTVFALIGLQLWAIVDDVDLEVGHALLAILVVLLTVVSVRPAWLFLTAGIGRLVRRSEHRRIATSSRELVIVSWAGMRGVVSLAAAQTLPLDTPSRSLLLTCTVAVIVGTLVLQGLTLPWVIRRMDPPGDPKAEVKAELDRARRQASEAIDARINEVAAGGEVPDRGIEMMRRWAALRDWRNWRDGDDRAIARLTSTQHWQREIVRIEREVFVQLRNSGELSEEVLRDLQQDLDLEEALIEGRLAQLDPPDRAD